MQDMGKSSSISDGAKASIATSFWRSNFRTDESYEALYKLFPSAEKIIAVIVFECIFKAVMIGSCVVSSSSSISFSLSSALELKHF